MSNTQDINNLEVLNCHKEDTEIIMFNNEIKKIQNIQIGEQIMGYNSKPLMVKNIIKGHDLLYNITHLSDNKSYNVNQEYKLYLRYIGDKRIKVCDNMYKVYWFDHINMVQTVQDFEFNEFTKFDARIKANLLYYSINEVKDIYISIDEFLNLPDKLQKQFKNIHYTICCCEKKVPIDSYIYGGMDGINIFNMVEGASISDTYKFNSMYVRSTYIAGVIDTYGYIFENMYKIEIYTKNKYIDDLIFMIKSIGFDAYIKENILSIYSNHLHKIPTKIKKITKNSCKYNNNITITLNTESQDCYGLEVMPNGKYILGNFIVSNSCY